MSDDAEKKRAEEREWTIKKSLPGLIAGEAKASLTSRDELAKRQPYSEQQSIEEKLAFMKQAQPDSTMSADWRSMTGFVSPLVASGGTVVDLGGSSGQFPKYLALSRPDVKVISIEPDAESYRMALEDIKKHGLSDRVTLIHNKVPEALAQIGQKADAVTSIYRTHLQSDADNISDMKAIKDFVGKTGASVVFHDLHRPKLQSTIDKMIQIYPADDASDKFRQNYASSLKGAYRDQELQEMLTRHIGGKWQDMPALPMAPAQMHMHMQKGTHVPRPGTTPEPVYPQTKEEFVKIGDSMSNLFKAGGLVDQGVTAVDESVKSVSTGLRETYNKLVAKPSPDEPRIVMPKSLSNEAQAQPEKAVPSAGRKNPEPG